MRRTVAGLVGACLRTAGCAASGQPTEETTFPQTFVIDHVRGYRERTATDG